MSRSLSQALRRFPQLLAAPTVAGLLVFLPVTSAQAQEWDWSLTWEDAKEESILTGIIAGLTGLSSKPLLLWIIRSSFHKHLKRKTDREILEDLISGNGEIRKILYGKNKDLPKQNENLYQLILDAKNINKKVQESVKDNLANQVSATKEILYDDGKNLPVENKSLYRLTLSILDKISKSNSSS